MPRDIQAIRVAGRAVGPSHPLFVIAEIGLNHGGSVGRALALVDASASAGASAVKLQTLEAAALVAHDAPAPAHVGARSMVDFFERFELDEDAHRRVIARAHARGVAALSAPFSEHAVDMLQRCGVDAFKIASGDLTWRQLIERCARTGKPLIISTGMAEIDEVGTALEWARTAGATDVALLHCVSAYPVPSGSENLRAIGTLADVFRVPVGLSDHARDTSAVPMAVALGASLYERHVMLGAGDGAIDSDVSSTPAALAALIDSARDAVAALGSGVKTCIAAERANRHASRRGLYAARPLEAGEVVAAADVVALRPAAGLPPGRLPELIGTTLVRAVERGAPFFPDDLHPSSRPGRVA